MGNFPQKCLETPHKSYFIFNKWTKAQINGHFGINRHKHCVWSHRFLCVHSILILYSYKFEFSIFLFPCITSLFGADSFIGTPLFGIARCIVYIYIYKYITYTLTYQRHSYRSIISTFILYIHQHSI